ncbi:hypothetical protein JAAARDRAFT_59943 [Jaapia argillacea MUCL 33604]|uniref:P-loop containing nucleoside triphosphate hydrolase protein n=1 Tax=Jaapia argillacea MUCL 33604 TaxID=933084 RepID=A0A067PKX9_9AGAM|nr:hypothetical protein JAAARDRAFT_59943 [Jaapia argillacea MUCL 33604]
MQSFRRFFSTVPARLHENPLGLPRSGSRPPPTIPRRSSGSPGKGSIAHVKKIVAVASGKGGVGKSTVAVNLAFSLAMRRDPETSFRPRIGILDLDIYGPSVPKLMGLESSPEPDHTPSGALIPLTNHSISCMSIGFLLPRSPKSHDGSSADTPVVWRGLMVQKAVQQLLFDVDWRGGEEGGEGIDVLIIDMPPGTGDVQLTLAQLVNVDGAVIVSTPQDVALLDVRRSIAMFRKVDVPITGTVLNQSSYTCPSCSTPHYIYGPPTSFNNTCEALGVEVLGDLPIVGGVSARGDFGVPYVLAPTAEDGENGIRWKETMEGIAEKVWGKLWA